MQWEECPGVPWDARLKESKHKETALTCDTREECGQSHSDGGDASKLITWKIDEAHHIESGWIESIS